MQTQVELNDELVKTALNYAKVNTNQELLTLALTEFVATHQRLDVRELLGTVNLRPDYDYKRLRTAGDDYVSS